VQQAEDMRDLEDKETNFTSRKELAPLLKPLDPKNVTYYGYFFFKFELRSYTFFKGSWTRHVLHQRVEAL